MLKRLAALAHSLLFQVVVAAAVAGCVLATGGEVRVWDGDYPPPPEPVEADIRLGAYIFPGWYRDEGRGDYPYRTHDEDSEWRLIAKTPAPRPLLGFYDDSLPEVNDWHIKWALEHGISYFAFDWYWNAGEHRLMRTLERGFLKARYARLMQFCIHWCNHGLDWRTRQWYPMMGLADAATRGGVMSARVTSDDPAFACPARIDASQYDRAVVRMKLDSGERGQLFWGGAGNPESERNSIVFETVADGQFHDYVLDLASVESWRGRFNRLRLDPNSGSAGSTVSIDTIRFLPKPGSDRAALRWEFDTDYEWGSTGTGGLDFSRKALVEMVEYLADTYFVFPNYLTVHGRPVLLIWNPRDLLRAHGGPTGFRGVLEAMNAVLHERGMKDLFLVSMHPGSDKEEAGFAAITGYGYYGVDFDSPYQWRGGHSVPYDAVITHYESMWRSIGGNRSLPYILPIGSNWDSRPRAGERAAVITGKTPAKFRTMCRNSLRYIDRDIGMAIIEAWNEWGEGSFIEPDKKWGFGFLDTVREVFTDATADHIDYVPSSEKVTAFSVLTPDEVRAASETELLPYPPPPVCPRPVRWRIDEPLPAASVLRAWEFDAASAQGWRGHGVAELSVGQGRLSCAVTTTDPQLIVGDVEVAIRDLGCLALRFRVSEGVTNCELFWSTTDDPELSAGKSFRFPVRSDGQWHTVQVSREREGKWDGTLHVLRLDVGRPGDRIEIDWIRLLRSQPGAP